MNIFINPLKKASSILSVMICAGMLSACTAPHNDKGDYASVDYDPIEPVNRGIFQFNRAIDVVLLRPIAKGYDAVMPERGKVMVSNFVYNIKEPVTFVNSVLQTDANNSFTTLWRFMLNSTIGIGGLFDVASEVGLKNRETSMGDTFAIYGADAGPYIVIPIIGPSNVRDGLGRLGDYFTDPVSYTNDPVFYSVVGVKTLDARYRNLKVVDDIYARSLDPYATFRSGYTQRRIAEIKSAIKARQKSIDAAKAQDTK
jgi:phospholipid-binding lipoprotein MlaA